MDQIGNHIKEIAGTGDATVKLKRGASDHTDHA